MKILIDVNHPAHVHYFRNFMTEMKKKGHSFKVINRDSKIINQLLDAYGIQHTIRNKRPTKKGHFRSMWYLFRQILWIVWVSLKFRPDLYMGFASSANAVTSFLFRKPCIVLDDTELNTTNHKIYLKFCSKVLTPFYFTINFHSDKQQYFDAYIEQLYLHSKVYKKDNAVLDDLGVKPKEYVLIRYTAFDAHHDLMANPVSEELRKAIVTECAKRYKVFISLEKDTDDEFYAPYKLNISPEKIHDVIANARFMVAQGATMPSEAFVLGVPYLRLSESFHYGYIDYQCEHYPDRAMQTNNEKTAIEMLNKLFESKIDSEKARLEVENSLINPTEYLINFVEDFMSKKTDK